ncbi:MAG: hypothetical protein WDN44_05225 [Sphingomonas sp.]
MPPHAAELIHASIDFVESDHVTLNADGTHLSTSLKDLQSLHVDTIKVSSQSMVISAGGSLASLSATDLPQIIGHEPGTAPDASFNPDVTLSVDGGALPTSFDVTSLANGLVAAGIDHLSSTGPLSLSYEQAVAFHDAGLDFAPASDITLGFSNIDTVDMSVLHALNIDHLDYSGATLDITADEAAAAVHAGVDIVESDNVVLHADGTHLSTSLKDLQSLHVDTIQLSAHSMMINAGGSLGSLSVADLPHIVGQDAGAGGASFNPDVTLSVDSGAVPASLDLTDLAHGLAAAGSITSARAGRWRSPMSRRCRSTTPASISRRPRTSRSTSATSTMSTCRCSMR